MITDFTLTVTNVWSDFPLKQILNIAFNESTVSETEPHGNKSLITASSSNNIILWDIWLWIINLNCCAWWWIQRAWQFQKLCLTVGPCVRQSVCMLSCLLAPFLFRPCRTSPASRAHRLKTHTPRKYQEVARTCQRWHRFLARPHLVLKEQTNTTTVIVVWWN